MDAPPPEKPKIIIVDNKDLRRAAVESLLESWAAAEGLEIISIAPDEIQDTLDTVSDCRMLIVSVGGEIISAEENMRLLARLRFKMPDVPLVIIADYESSDETAAALRAGAQGYIQNGIGPELATRALSLLLRGGSYFPLAALRELLRRAPRENDGPDGHSGSNGNSGPGHSLLTMGERLDEMSSLDDLPLLQLTTRQREVVYFLRQGNSNKLIARRLGMAETTVKVHVRQIMRKLGASNRTQAAILLREMQRVAA